MDQAQAIEKAREKAARWGFHYLVIKRTDHPEVSGDYFYVIKDTDKRLWTDGEELIYVATPLDFITREVRKLEGVTDNG